MLLVTFDSMVTDVGVILAIGKFLRMALTELQQRIMYEDMPEILELVSFCEVAVDLFCGCCSISGELPKGISCVFLVH